MDGGGCGNDSGITTPDPIGPTGLGRAATGNAMKERAVRRPRPPRLGVCVILALLVAAPLGACGDEPVFPLDVDPPRTSVPAPVPVPLPTTSAPSRPTTQPPRRMQTRTPSPTASSTCLGPVEVRITADEELATRGSFCIAVGGVLRIEGQGPGTVSVDPPEMVYRFPYEAAVHRIQFLYPGTVVVSIVRNEQRFTIPVVVRSPALTTHTPPSRESTKSTPLPAGVRSARTPPRRRPVRPRRPR